MNAKYRRLFITIIIILTLGLATKLILMALEDNIVYFYTPNDLIEKFGDTQNIHNKIRIGGLVLESSIKKEGEKTNWKHQLEKINCCYKTPKRY